MGSFHRKRKNVEEEEFLGIGKRKPRVEPKPERTGFVGRFPSFPDGRPALGFATLSHSSLKTWTQVARAEGHNTRKIEAPNVREDAPKPIELLDQVTGSYSDRIKAVLEEHGVPTKVRKNVGAIATEDVFSASPEYWNRNGDWKSKPLAEIIEDPVVQAALAYAKKKHGKRLISVSLHVDEQSPHVHVVAVPLVQQEHAVRGRLPKDCPRDAAGKPIDPRPKVLKWSLAPSVIRGQSKQLEKNHDEWAAECEKFGLVRGLKGSEMTDEERRARRNRQTGRASMAEKVARERRESLGAEAEEDRERARKLVEEAKEKEAAAQAARAEADRLKVAQEGRERELLALVRAAEADRAAAAAERKKAAEAKNLAEGREAALAKDTKRLSQQIEALATILDPAEPMESVVQDGQLLVRGSTPEELALLHSLPQVLSASVDKFFRLAASASTERTELNNERAQLERDREQLRSDRDLYEKAADAIVNNLDRAREFLGAWIAIPEAQRTPQVNAAVRAAASLAAEGLPPGYKLPHQRGRLGIG